MDTPDGFTPQQLAQHLGLDGYVSSLADLVRHTGRGHAIDEALVREVIYFSMALGARGMAQAQERGDGNWRFGVRRPSEAITT